MFRSVVAAPALVAVLVVGLLAALAWAVPAVAQDVPVKLASVVPAGSIWDKELQRLAADWKQATKISTHSC